MHASIPRLLQFFKTFEGQIAPRKARGWLVSSLFIILLFIKLSDPLLERFVSCGVENAAPVKACHHF